MCCLPRHRRECGGRDDYRRDRRNQRPRRRHRRHQDDPGGLFDGRGPREPFARKTYPSADYPSLESMVREFLDEVKVDGTEIETPGLFWGGRPGGRGARQAHQPHVGGRRRPALQSLFGWSGVALLNDMRVGRLRDPGSRAGGSAYPERRRSGARRAAFAVLAPGTGLGEGYLTFCGGSLPRHPSEGSHASFAPVGPLQMGLLAYMNAQGFDHVSFERVCSGGLGVPQPVRLSEDDGSRGAGLAGRRNSPPPRIPRPSSSQRPSDGDGRANLARATLDLFVEILGPKPATSPSSAGHRRHLPGWGHVAPHPRRVGEAGISRGAPQQGSIPGAARRHAGARHHECRRRAAGCRGVRSGQSDG